MNMTHLSVLQFGQLVSPDVILEPLNASHLVEYWDYRVADKKVEKTNIKLIYR